MTLVECLALHEPALRASFRVEYGKRVEDYNDPLEASEWLVWIRPGSAVWRSFGGPLALSEVEHSLRMIEFRLRVLAWQNTKDGQTGSKQPTPPQNPPYASEIEAQQHRKLQKAQAFMRRQRKR